MAAVVPLVPRTSPSSTFRKYTARLEQVFVDRATDLSASDRDQVLSLLPSIISHIGFPDRVMAAEVLHLQTLNVLMVEWLWITMVIAPTSLLTGCINDLVDGGLYHTHERFELNIDEINRLDSTVDCLVSVLRDRHKALQQ
jgi:hypothetical protein